MHIESYLNNPHVELAALCDINEERVRAKGEKYGVSNLFTDAEELLRLPGLDAVSVCTWNSAHADCAVKALNAGKHVLCEKPMAVNAAQALEMKAAAEKSGKLLMIGFVRRFGNDCKILQDFIRTDFLGEIYYAKATYLRRHGCPGGWFGEKARSGGGPLIDLGVHVIDLTRFLLGNPAPVSVYGAAFDKLKDRPGIGMPSGYVSDSKSDRDIFDVEDLASALIRFENGAVLSVEASFSLNTEKDTGTVELFGTKAGAKLSPELVLYTENNGHLTNLGFYESTALSFDGLFQNEIDHFVDCARNDTACLAPAQDGVELMRILDAVYESARTGHEVLL
jgi:predicted dehydrogenase